MNMNVGMNLSSFADFQPAQYADKFLTGNTRLRVISGTMTLGADGWPVGPGTVSFNSSFDVEPTEYKLIVTAGVATDFDINQGADHGGHVHGKVDPKTGIGTFTARGLENGSLPCALTFTSPGLGRWSVVRSDEYEAWKADHFALSPSWVARRQGFSVVRDMDLMGTNLNTDTKYIDPDRNRPAPFISRVPLSEIVKISDALNADPWINIPVLCDDDGVRAIAKAMGPAIAAGRKIYVEFGNEVWNQAFLAYKTAVAQETALWYAAARAAYDAALVAWKALPVGSAGSAPQPPAPPTGQKWYGYRAAQVSKILQSIGWVLGRDFEMAIGCFPAMPQLAPVVWSGVSAANASAKDFSLWITTFYIHGDIHGGTPEAFANTVAMVKANNLDAAFDTIYHGKSSSIDWLVGNIQTHAAVAKANGLKLAGYEGQFGFYTIPFFADSALVKANAGITKADVIAFFKRIIHDPRQAIAMHDILAVLEAAGMVLACPFNDQSMPGENGLWGLEGTPAWDVLVNWNKSIPDLSSLAAEVAEMQKQLAALAGRIQAATK